MSAETPGRFGAWGGRYASEASIAALDELEEVDAVPGFIAELKAPLRS